MIISFGLQSQYHKLEHIQVRKHISDR